uniref:YqaJ viral recombinase domain-containing protein n=2 Tax=Lygus hesperus TaxID=30085 RepID=A0A0A9YW51_LYGHE
MDRFRSCSSGLGGNPERKLEECGLFVHAAHGFLAASLDCLVDDDGILEVKCPKSAEKLTFQQAISTLKSFCLTKQGTLKQNHNYFYQIQGQLEITDRQYCDFVVWAPKFAHVERVDRDREFWNNVMFPKLLAFFENSLLPELVDPRRCRSMPLRNT